MKDLSPGNDSDRAGGKLLGHSGGAWTQKSRPAKAAGQDMAMPMPQPAPEMTKLIKMMSGTWSVSEKADPGPMAPKGGLGQGHGEIVGWPGRHVVAGELSLYRHDGRQL